VKTVAEVFLFLVCLFLFFFCIFVKFVTSV